MGGSVSSGRSNDELVDNLLEAYHITTPLIERVFRAVDRGRYFVTDAADTAYKDLAWKNGNLHISAPCIYSTVMEALELEPGLSFLNIGSGTGYLSTMVGLLLGTNGINHGIEIHADVIEYAYQKLEDFKKFSRAIDEFDFCEPKFMQGNCLTFSEGNTRLYDRIYCGAACPVKFQQYMQNMLKIGGILVVPLNDELFKIKRESEFEWRELALLSVSFAYLVVPPVGFKGVMKPIDADPLPLQTLCRSVVRNILRKNIEKEHPPAKNASHMKAPKKKRMYRRFAGPCTDDMDSSENEPELMPGSERLRIARRQICRREQQRLWDILLSLGDRPTSDPSNSNPDSRGEDEENTEDSLSRRPFNQQLINIIEGRGSDYDRLGGHAAFEENSYTQQMNNAIRSCFRFDSSPKVEQERLKSEIRETNTGDTQCDGDPSEADSESSAAADPSPSTTTSNKNGKREKSDSGLGDEIVEAQESSDDEQMGLDTILSCDEDGSSEKRSKRGVSDSSSGTEEDIADPSNDVRRSPSLYTQHMVQKIQELPLPPLLKNYLNYDRDMNINE